MELKQQRLTDLLGGSSQRYRQCVFTTYVFDPLAFEAFLLPALKRAGIRNVIVLTDRSRLDELLGRMDAGEFSGSRGYTVLPIVTKGSFHPKMMLCVGANDGLLAVGSGNLTSSGLGGNREVWASFHRTAKDNGNDPIFATAWDYLQTRLLGGSPVQQQAVSWLGTHAPWLQQLEGKNRWVALPRQREARLLRSPDETTMFSALVNAAQGATVEKLTVVSPFFDRDGRLLKQLIEQFKAHQIFCLVDRNFSGAPQYFPIKDLRARSQVQWKDWNSQLNPEEEPRKRRRPLHAKIIHLQLLEEELLLFGSANCTEAALGDNTTPARNDELSVLLRRKGRGNYLAELGLKPEEHGAFNLPEDPPLATKITKEDDSNDSFTNRIIFAEQEGNELHYSLLRNPSPGTCVRAQILDHKVEIDLNHQQGTVEWPLSGAPQPNLIALYQNQKRISPYALIIDARRIFQNDPDPLREALNKKIEAFRDSEGMDGLAGLMKYLEINRDFYEADQNEHQNYRSSALYVESSTSEHEDLSPEELAVLSAQAPLQGSWQNSNTFSPKREINILLREMIAALKTEGEQNEDEEQLLHQSAITQQEGDHETAEAGNIEDKHLPHREAQDLKRYLRHAVQYLERYNELPDKNFSRRRITGTSTSKDEVADAGRSQISSLTLALQLLRLYQNCRFLPPPSKKKPEKEGKEKQAVIHQAIFPLRYGKQQGINDLPDYLLSLISGLRLLTGRPLQKKPQTPDLVKEELLLEAIELGWFLTLSTLWSGKNKVQRDLLLLDLSEQYFRIKGVFPEVIRLKQMMEGYQGIEGQTKHFGSNLEHLEQQLLPELRTFFAMSLKEHQKAFNKLNPRRPYLCYGMSFGFYLVEGFDATKMKVLKPGLCKRLGKPPITRTFPLPTQGVVVFRVL